MATTRKQTRQAWRALTKATKPKSKPKKVAVPRPRFVVTSYLSQALTLDRRSLIIKRLVEGIRASKIKFDSIAFRGLSGALIAPSVADILKKNLIAVRKEKTCHSCYRVEGTAGRYIIIDDQVASGETVRQIKEKIEQGKEFKDKGCELVAIFLYRYCNTTDVRPMDKRTTPGGLNKLNVPMFG